jgi:hypothetical protein
LALQQKNLQDRTSRQGISIDRNTVSGVKPVSDAPGIVFRSFRPIAAVMAG